MFPEKYAKNLSDLQQLMLLRCFRVDRVYRAITNFVTQRMGEKYVTPPVISFESVFEQSTPFSPIVFILSPGADPAGDLGKLAERMGYGGNRLKFLAMGQGQEKVPTLPICGQFYYLSIITTVGCSAAVGHCFISWSLADVAELSFASSMVEGSREGVRETGTTTS